MKTMVMIAALATATVFVGCDNKEAPGPYGKPTTSEGKPVERAQVKDPVCGMLVDSEKAKVHTHKDVKYYFCSAKCEDTFEKAPASYTSNPAK